MAAIVTGAGLLIAPALGAGFLGLAHALALVQKLAIVGGLSSLLAPELPGIDAARTLAENLTIQSNPLAVRAVPWGRHGIAGQVLFRENIKNSGDTPDELLLILGLAGYPATSLEKYSLNGELVFEGDSTTGPGAITTGKFANDLWVWFRTGEETTAAFPDIAALSTTWNAKVRKLRGIPSIAIRLKVTEKLEGRLEPLAQIKGAKLYDPRLDSTVPGGSGLHRFDDPTTWAWSQNPKLAELLYLRGAEVNGVRIFGMGKPAAAIDLENFASEANICEEQITVNAGGTIDRYTMNGRLVPNRDHRSNLNQLLSASAGTMDASGGVYRTFAGAWRAPSMTLTEADIDGAPTDIRLQKSPSEEVNIISGSFADPNDAWEVKEYPELRDETSITQVGENAKTIDLPFTNDHRIGQRIAKIFMKRLNAARAFGANYWLSTIPLQPGDIVTQTYARYGITSETFRVNLWGLEAAEDRSGNRRLTVPMALIEEQQSWFDWDAATEEKSTPTLTALPTMDRRPKLITLDGVPVFEGPAPPANPKVGWLWRDTDVDILFRWSGAAWVATSDNTSSHADAIVFRQATAPANPQVGWLWLDTDVNIVFRWDGSAWVEYTASPIQVVADPQIRRGAAFWDVSDTGASYVIGAGTNGTDAIELRPDSNPAQFLAAARRGPDAFDATTFDGMSVEVRWRTALADNGTGSWTHELHAVIVVSDEDGSNPATYFGRGSRLWSDTDTLDVFHNDTATILIDETNTGARYLQVGVFSNDLLPGPDFHIDFVDASVGPRSFAGVEKPGLVRGTISTADPSGTPVDGEIWIKHEA